MRALVLLFLAVFGLTVIPAFAPPTWMVFSCIGFRYVTVNVAHRITLESTDALPYFSVYFVVSQILLLSLIYVFTRVDWRAVLGERKFRWVAKAPVRPQAKG